MKILFTTQFIEKNGWYEYFSNNSRSIFRLVYPLKRAYGIRFIKQNVPFIEMLEFPLWEDYVKKLSEGWDVVGFSFLTQHTGRIVKMAEAARKAGVKVLWGGNYGVTNPEVSGLFDRTFTGYAEREVAEAVGSPFERLRHPPLIDQWYISPSPLKVQLVGQMQTSRGCPMKCSFCHTPRWEPKPYGLPIESLDETMRFMKRSRVDWIAVHDENFGIMHDHSRKVLELFRRHRLFWTPQSRPEIALKRLDEWCDANFMGMGLGIESVEQEALETWDKNLRAGIVMELAEELHRRDRYIFGFYMLGNEHATYESTIEEIETLARYDIDYVNLTVATPYPGTPLFDQTEEKFGFFNKDWSLFDTKQLVWRHPSITPDQMKKLHEYACLRINTPQRLFKFMSRIYKNYAANLKSYAKAGALVSSFPIKSYMLKKELPFL